MGLSWSKRGEVEWTWGLVATILVALIFLFLVSVLAFSLKDKMIGLVGDFFKQLFGVG